MKIRTHNLLAHNIKILPTVSNTYTVPFVSFLKPDVSRPQAGAHLVS